jgi:hypothetical protein
MPRHSGRFTLEKLLSRIGWLVVAGAALSLSAYSLYWVGIHYGLPPILAGLVSAAFDGAALVCADLALRYARSHGDSGFGPRLGVFILAGASAYLNMQHAIINGDPPAARVLYAAPPITAIAIYELHIRWERRGALRKAGRVPAALPAFGRYAWLLFPLRTLGVMRRIVAHRLNVLETNAGVSRSISGVSGSMPELDGTPDQRMVRVWARMQGLPVGERGPIPAQITERYMLEIVSGSNGKSNGHSPEKVQQMIQGSDPE